MNDPLASPEGTAPDQVTYRIDPDAVRAYSQRTIDEAVRSGPVPLVGSPEWCALPDSHICKRASVLYAARMWAAEHTGETDYTAVLNGFLDQLAEVDDYLQRLVDKRASIAVSLCQDWGRGRPSWEELQRRRASYADVRSVDPEATSRWVETGQSEPTEPTATPTTPSKAGDNRAA